MRRFCWHSSNISEIRKYHRFLSLCFVKLCAVKPWVSRPVRSRPFTLKSGFVDLATLKTSWAPIHRAITSTASKWNKAPAPLLLQPAPNGRYWDVETLTLQRLKDFSALSTTAQGILPCGRRAKSSKAMRVPWDASLSSSTCQQMCFFFLVQNGILSLLCLDAMNFNQKCSWPRRSLKQIVNMTWQLGFRDLTGKTKLHLHVSNALGSCSNIGNQ